ncbi:MAG: DUF819 family protein, partial [Silvanigrellaceae bacterium]|nr:DUF819 family protein [Silvanigrellaceae bacterium]
MMDNRILLLIIFGSAFICYAVERKVAWISHVSSVCLLILFAMLLSQTGIVPAEAELYDFLQGPIVLIAIVMMTLDFRFQDILKVPVKILIIFTIGIFGSAIGGLISGFIASNELGINAYKLAAQLTANYIGGGENAAAIRTIYNIPHNYFTAVFAVDNIITSLWIVISIWFTNNKGKEAKTNANESSNFDEAQVNILSIMACLFVSLGIVLLAEFVSKNVGFLHKILWMSIFSIIVGQIKFFKEYFKSSYIFGTVLFTGFFFSIGAISNIRAIFQLPSIIIIMPLIVVLTHIIFIIIAARIFKI